MNTTRKNSRSFSTVLYGAVNVASLNCSFGLFEKEDDGTIEVPDGAVEIALSHGFYRTREEALAGPKKPPKPAAMAGVGYMPSAEEIAAAMRAPVAKAAPKISPEERVAEANRFDLKDYCEGNDIEIPPRTNNDALRALVLEHMKAEAAGTLPKPETEQVVKTSEGEGKSEADEK